MNKSFLWFLPLAAFCSCGGSRTAPSDSDTVVSVGAASVETPVRHVAYLTASGVGNVAVGSDIYALAPAEAGLYDSKDLDASPDAVTVTFSDGEGEQFVAYDFGEGNVDVINVTGPGIAVKAPRGDINLGSPFGEVLALPGVQPEWAGFDNGGMWYWTWEGLWFAPAQEGLPAALASRLYHYGQAPTESDFNGAVTVGFIGTGLPF